MEEAGDARSDDVDEVGDGDLLVVEEVHSGEEALALLRHVKWFYSRALSRHSCTVVIRILKLEGSLSEKPQLVSAQMLASSSS